MQIKFNNGTEEKALNVQNCFVYTYNAVKTVLKLIISESNHAYAEVAELKNCTGKICLYEGEELKSEYTGYNLGAEGFTCNYTNGTFNVELTHEGSTELRLSALESTIDDILAILETLNTTEA